MIAISSHRPFSDCPDEIRINQTRAIDSWSVFEKVILFGDYEAELARENVKFFPCVGKPFIWQLTDLAATQNDWACIINSDIVLGVRWREVEAKLRSTWAIAAMSKRYNFDTTNDDDAGTVDDNGLDFFAAHPDTWALVAREVPRVFQLGKILWDTWMIGFLAAKAGLNFADLTPAKVIFHPRHGHRTDQHIAKVSDKYIDRVRWPIMMID